MTVSFFTKQKKGISLALLYGFFIVLIYVLFGTLISFLFGQTAPNFISTHWFPNLLFFTVFVVFGLSFLGLFEITLPSSVVNKMDANADKGGIAGVFFMAFTLVLVSFSCTGPIAGTILGLGAQGQLIKPIVGMLGFSLAFAIPFTLFAIFPSWLKSLPKSGGWLNSVKVVLGFLELALALKFLSTADQVYHWHLLDREIYLALWIAIFGMTGLYLIGKITLPHDSKIEKISVWRALFAIITFAFTVYLIPGMWGAPLKGLSGWLPPLTTFDSFGASTGFDSAQPPKKTVKYENLFKLPHNLDGFFDYQEALSYAKSVNKPLFIDFTGHGCVNCRKMEENVWSDPKVLQKLKDDYVILALYVDDKTEKPEAEWFTSKSDGAIKKSIGAQNLDFEITKFNGNAQPYYCLVDSKTEQLIKPPLGYDLDVDGFLRFLE
jgi:thiol:disulfide interchange protein